MSTPPLFPSPHVVLPTETHTCTVVFLHGRGDNGPDFARSTFEAAYSAGPSPADTLASTLPNWKWIFPTARNRYSTVFQEHLNEWFDIQSLADPSRREDLQVDGLRESVGYVLRIVEKESRLVGASNVVLGGISQGCATSVHALLAGSERLGGWVGVSGWIPFKRQLERIANEAPQEEVCERLASFNRDVLCLEGGEATSSRMLETPALLCHGIDDDKIDVSLGKQVHNVLEKFGMKPI